MLMSACTLKPPSSTGGNTARISCVKPNSHLLQSQQQVIQFTELAWFYAPLILLEGSPKTWSPCSKLVSSCKPKCINGWFMPSMCQLPASFCNFSSFPLQVSPSLYIVVHSHILSWSSILSWKLNIIYFVLNKYPPACHPTLSQKDTATDSHTKHILKI